MFWKRFGFQHASGIDSLLDREDVELEAILDDDELLNECKSGNTRLIDYFQRVDVLRKLLGYASGEIEGEGMGRYKYPHVATEVLCSEIWSIVETCLREAGQLLVPFWDTLLDMDPQEMAHKTLVPPHFAKINSVFISKKPEEMLHFIKSQPSIIDRFLSHIETPAFVDLLFRIIQMEEMIGGDGVIEWLSSENLIPRLAAMLSPQHSPDLHAVVADVLKGIISLCAPSTNHLNDHQMALVTNCFSRQLVSHDVVQTLVAFMLDGLPTEDTDPEPNDSVTAVAPNATSIPALASQQPWDNSSDDTRSYSSGSSSSSASEYHSVMSTATERSTSSLLHVSSVLIELMRKNNSDFFEPYLFHTLRHRLIQMQQQYLPQLDRSGMNPAQRIEADRDILERTMAEMVDQMGIVHFGALLTALSTRLHEFQALLVSPRSLTGPIPTTFGEMMPLTMERFRICELYAELLHCSGLSLLNRPDGYGPTYDSEGRLIGGLSALEELARVVANGANDPNTPPPHVSRVTDADSPTNSRDLQVSVSSMDQMSIVSGSSEGETEYLSNADDSDGRSDDESNSDEVTNMEEISVHDEPSREPLPVAPFAVPNSNQTQSSPEGPDIVAAYPDVSVPFSGSGSQGYSRHNEIDPFTDPNEMPPSPPSEPTVVDASFPSASPLENSEIILPADETTPSSRHSSASGPFGPPGEFFKSRFLNLGVVTTILDLFFEFPWNNFLHTVIYDLLHQIMTGRVDRGLNRDLVISLFRDGKLLHRIIEAQQLNDDAVAKPKGVRLGYMGHLTQISEDVINAFAHYPPDLAATLREFAPQPDWNLYVSGRFQETKDRDASLLGGGKPIVTPGQVQALRASLAAAAAAGRGLADLAIDEGDRLPPSGMGPGSGFRSHMNGNGNGIGASPVSTNSRRPHQNVVFSPINDEDEPPRRASGGSNQFARYLAQQINGEVNGPFESSSSDASDDEDDDVGWLGEPHYAGHLGFSADGRSSPSFVSSLGTMGNGPSPSRGADSAFDDSFETSAQAGRISFHRTFDEDGDGGFGPFLDPATAKVAHNNFTADLSGSFIFPPDSSPAPSFDLDAEFANGSSSSGFAFGNGNVFEDDDEDGFGEFQGGLDLEVVMSTNADGTSKPLTINGRHDDDFDEGFAVHPPREDEDGARTPKAMRASFGDHFGETLEDVDPDPFGFRRRPPTGDPTGSDSSNRLNAMSSLEQTFGCVSLDDSHRDDLLDAFEPRTPLEHSSSDPTSFNLDEPPIQG